MIVERLGCRSYHQVVEARVSDVVGWRFGVLKGSNE